MLKLLVPTRSRMRCRIRASQLVVPDLDVAEAVEGETVLELDDRELSSHNSDPIRQMTLPLKVEKPSSTQVLVTPEPTCSTPSVKLPPSDERRRASGVAGDNRVLEELRIMDQRFQNPRCPECGRTALAAITNEGVVVTCKECNKSKRVESELLQRLAERLSPVCFSCKGRALKSSVGKYGNYLKCQNCGSNNSWQEINRRIR